MHYPQWTMYEWLCKHTQGTETEKKHILSALCCKALNFSCIEEDNFLFWERSYLVNTMFLTSMEIIKPIDKNTSFAQKSYLKEIHQQRKTILFFFH